VCQELCAKKTQNQKLKYQLKVMKVKVKRQIYKTKTQKSLTNKTIHAPVVYD
jgi:glutamine amidotransferase PdxT